MPHTPAPFLPALAPDQAHDHLPPLQTIYADAFLLVLNKPPGLLAVPGKTSAVCLSLQVQNAYPDALIVHRLDMATSGLMVMARGLAMQRLLNASFAQRQVRKRYVAVVHGDCSIPSTAAAPAATDWQTIALPIRVDWPQRPLRMIDPLLGKPSTTHWRCTGYDAASHTSQLELEPVTGRSHQLRVHLQAIGHPILGDRLYAPGTIASASPRLLLHAAELGFAHPATGAWCAFAQAASWQAPA
ncbi:MAG: RluA family pseudouridine synthase [Rhodoferax sp.]|nr:RluA family pseudouridine synthase [Rhodoferax sp.]